MRTGEGTSTRRKRCDGERASVALKRKRKGRGRQTLSVRGKTRLASHLWTYRSMGLRSPERTPRAH
jgi:hypothetical protein